jgi:DNA-binding NarL/FixJ family response regulator
VTVAEVGPGIPPVRVTIVDDHAVVRGGLEQLLNAEPDIEVVGVAADGAAGIELAARLHPDVILMDLSMPGMDGVEATRRLQTASPEIQVVVLTSFADRTRVLDALEAGAVGYLLKDSEPGEITAGVRAAAAGGSPLDPRAAKVLLESRREGRPAGSLTDREREVLELVAQGLANKQIARRLGITERTVKAHLTRVFATLGVTDRTQAALWAKEHLRAT